MNRPPPLAWLLLAGAAQHALARHRSPRPLSTVAAGVLAAGSAAALGGSLAAFRGHGTTVDPMRPNRAEGLVTDGPNAVTRNPMYVGMAGVLLAHATWRRSFAALVPVAGFVVVLDRTQVAAEECALRARFGREYDDYCRRVPRWLGR